MTFTRTNSGLKNYNRFYRSNLTLYVEGKLLGDTPDEGCSRPDTRFYQALCSRYLSGKVVKVKLVGNRKNALDYHKKIIDESIDGALVIVDRDYDGILLSELPKPKLMMTYGYSWENDFWSEALLLETIKIATVMDDEAVGLTKNKIRRVLPRLRKISALNVAAHIDGETIFKVKGKSKGVNLTPSSDFPLSREECRRIAAQLPSMCDAMKKIYILARRQKCEKLIQGHLLEFVSLKVLAYAYSSTSGSIIGNQSIFKNIALSSFLSKPESFITADANEYYEKEFARAV